MYMFNLWQLNYQLGFCTNFDSVQIFLLNRIEITPNFCWIKHKITPG